MRRLRHSRSHGALYADVYRSISHRLTAVDSLGQSKTNVLSKGGAPAALVDYYTSAGSARPLHSAYDILLMPKDVFTKNGHVIFYTEHQDVCRYGFAADCGDDDPPVYMTCDSECSRWYKVCDSISEFLSVMLIWNATFGGGHKVTGHQIVPGTFSRKIVKSGVTYRGIVNGMKAYSFKGFSICHVKWDKRFEVFFGWSSDQGARLAREWDLT